MRPLLKPTFPLARLLRLLLIGVIISAVVAYALYQARFLLQGPQITLTDEPAVVQDNRTINLTGTTANITAIYLQGRPIVTDEYGTFREQLVLENGYTVVRLEARDRYGRTTVLQRDFVYQPASSATSTLPTTNS